MYQTISHLRVLRMYRRLFALVAIILFLSFATSVKAQNPEWVVYNTENSELPGNEVIEVAFDPAGAIWVGTRLDGLAKFDEETWTVYTTDNSKLPSNTVPALTVDLQGDLWVGTGDGLGMFDGQTWYSFTSEKTDLPYNAIHALAIDHQGPLWIGTGRFYDLGGGGLAKLDKTFFKWAVYTTDNSDLPGNQILALAVDARGHLWAGTENGKVAMFDGNTWKVYTSDNPGRPWGPVPALVCDTQGRIWIGTDGRGVVRFDGAAWTGYTTQNSGLPGNNVHALAIDGEGILWVGTEHGLAKFDGATWTVYTPDNSGLPNRWIWALVPDLQGNLWIGTMSGGVAVYREGGVLFPEKVTKVEDLVGIWEGWMMGSVVYRQFEADGTLKCANNLDGLRNSSLLRYSGRFWFEGEVFKFTESLAEASGRGPGAYEVWVRKRDGKSVHLSFHDMGDPDPMRAHDWGRGMTRVEP